MSGITLHLLVAKSDDDENPGDFPWVDVPEDIDTLDKIRKFDGEVCKKGIKKFLRKATKAELDAFEVIPEGDCAFIREIKPGVRTKLICFRHNFSNQ